MQSTDDRGSNSSKADFLSPRPMEAISLTEYNELDEIARLRLAVLKKEESDLLAELDKLATERDLHMREVRRIKDEDQVCDFLNCIFVPEQLNASQ